MSEKLKKVREHLENDLEYFKEREFEEYKRTPFRCDFCKEDITDGFVMLDIFKNMNDWYNNYIGGTFKVFHNKCFDEWKG